MRCVLSRLACRQLVANLALTRQEGNGFGGDLERTHPAIFFRHLHVERALHRLVEILNDERARRDFCLIDDPVGEAYGDRRVGLGNAGDLWRIAAQ